MSTMIKNQSNSLNKIYKSTLGRSQYSGILQKIERRKEINEEIQETISNIKNQVELELDLLVKEFQKIILIEKQEYFKQLDSYQKTLIKNIDFVKLQTQNLMEYENSLKYYANPNNLYMKIVN